MAGNEDLIMQYLMQQGGANQANMSIAKKQALLNQLRQQTQMPGMIQGGGARTVRAAHPLSMLADVGGQLAGGYEQKGLDTQSNDLMTTSRNQLADLQKLIAARRGAAPVAPPPMVGPEPGIDMTQAM
jgi:hypothetical protein